MYNSDIMQFLFLEVEKYVLDVILKVKMLDIVFRIYEQKKNYLR